MYVEKSGYNTNNLIYGSNSNRAITLFSNEMKAKNKHYTFNALKDIIDTKPTTPRPTRSKEPKKISKKRLEDIKTKLEKSKLVSKLRTSSVPKSNKLRSKSREAARGGKAF